MAAEASRPLARERTAILTVLLVLASAAWVLLAWQATSAEMGMPGPTMGLRAPLFLAMWVTMMVAMMFPTAAPMILMFQRVQSERHRRGQSYVPTVVFVATYLLLWSLFGLVAYAVASLAEGLAASSPLLREQAGRIGGVTLVLAGLYQLSPLKRTCLAKCRTPLDFILTSWRDGIWGAVRMGLEHGVYCLGCCWMLFVILFPLGIMNLAAMALITLVIFAEKTLPRGHRIGQGAAIALLLYGAVVLVAPELLPTFLPSGPMSMPEMPMPQSAPPAGAPSMPGHSMPGI